MANSKATTVKQYLSELPPDRRATIAAVRDVVLKNLPDGYEEGILWGVIMYSIPLSRLPETYNKQPLGYVALAAQKNFNSLYLMSVYGDAAHAKAFKADYAAAGKKLDMGKSCVHFQTIDDLPLDLIARTVAAVPAEKWIAIYEASRRGMKSNKRSTKKAVAKLPAKKRPTKH